MLWCNGTQWRVGRRRRGSRRRGRRTALRFDVSPVCFGASLDSSLTATLMLNSLFGEQILGTTRLLVRLTFHVRNENTRVPTKLELTNVSFFLSLLFDPWRRFCLLRLQPWSPVHLKLNKKKVCLLAVAGLIAFAMERMASSLTYSWNKTEKI